MAYIGKQPVIGNFVKLDAISVVNGQASYTMQNGGANFTAYANVNQFLVSLNGILQSPTTSFTVASSTITFASNLVTGDVIDFIIVLGNTLDVGVPSDNTVSLAKLTATGTKDATTFLRGDNTFAEAGGGKVLQVVQGISTTSVSSTSSTYVTTGLSASITPSSTSSKILVLTNFASQIATSSNTIRLTLKRGATDIDTSGDGFAKLRVTASNLFGNTPMNVLDSPATTSSTTYEAFFKSSSGNAEVMAGNSSGIMILMEIGA